MARTPTLPNKPSPLAHPQNARARLTLGPFSAEAHVEVTPLGLLAAGVLVSAILLSVVPVVRAARAKSAPAS